MVPAVLRDHGLVGAREVTKFELFFDLVYVFAVTQLSHRLLQHLTVRGAVETLVLFLAVWWAWNSTAWVTNYRAAHRDADLLPCALRSRGCSPRPASHPMKRVAVVAGFEEEPSPSFGSDPDPTHDAANRGSVASPSPASKNPPGSKSRRRHLTSVGCHGRVSQPFAAAICSLGADPLST